MKQNHFFKLHPKIVLLVCLTSLLTLAQNRESSANPDLSKNEMTLSPGDRIKISYIDIGPQGIPIEKSSILEVRHDGTIFHELLKVVYVQDLTVKQVENLLTVKFSEFFTQPQVVVSIVEKTTIKVFLWGGVNNVGVYRISPGTTIAEFIVNHGGVSSDANISKITLTRKDGSVVIFDLERYLFSNDETNNVELHDGDKIIVPRLIMKDEYARLSKGYILQTGNVLEITINELSTMEKNPAKPENYVIDQDGNIFHRRFGLVRLGGLSVDKAQTTLTELAKKYYREPVVTIDVVELTSRSVFVFGEVNRPGIYPIEGNIRLAEFLANIGGLTQNADPRKIIVTRENHKPITFDLNEYLFDRKDEKNIYLEDGDRIIVLSRSRGFFVNLAEKIQPFSTLLYTISTILSIYLFVTYL
ncbi:MAG TPA: polysaccharide biosynthesis/export family protein [Candidatus Marinimicrobia bacterium]|nr:polysaccharide biosynthesis/export family protein [Candidatus Neomarinimicrobiota bacterium]HRS51477.1 polysaccharide biosynthesis/export family protein [Candidatus Neomarinimicrobiota bacterium]HRU92747.1 polysaccharide biosynthesis/export family protein [Candidatus Neomarinimicrobiota bacterium]